MYYLFIFLLLVVIWYLLFKFYKKREYEAILEKEEKYLHLPISTHHEASLENYGFYKLVSGGIVISSNYFGNDISCCEETLDRARREAIIRMKENALPSNEIINVKFETNSISKNIWGNICAVEIVAYGTAVY